jgi:hypothetical protein
MSEPQGVTGFDDIHHDLEGASRRAAWVERYASEARAPDLKRNLEVRLRPKSAAPAAVAPAGLRGEQFVAGRPPELRARYQTLFCLEALYGVDLDFGFLIASACQVLEAELEQLLMTPARGIGGALAGVLASEGKSKQSAILADWAEGKLAATIGMASLVLLALRRGLAAGDGVCRDFLARHFRAGYASLIAAGGLGPALDRLREGFRNPACHGLRSFDRRDYEQFARLAVSASRFSKWAATGPAPDVPPPAGGVLHHHLAESLHVSPATEQAARPTPLEQLLDLATPRESRLSIRVEPQHADALPAPDLATWPPRLVRPFRLGDALCFHFRANQDCEVALIDIGTSGTIAAVLPNAGQPRARVKAGETARFPAPDADFEILLGGSPGRERVVALAWLRGSPVSLQPEGDDSFRTLTPADVSALCEAVQRLDKGEWAACVSEFEITT